MLRVDNMILKIEDIYMEREYVRGNKNSVSKDIEQEMQTNIAFVAAKTKSQHSLGCRENTQG